MSKFVSVFLLEFIYNHELIKKFQLFLNLQRSRRNDMGIKSYTTEILYRRLYDKRSNSSLRKKLPTGRRRCLLAVNKKASCLSSIVKVLKVVRLSFVVFGL